MSLCDIETKPIIRGQKLGLKYSSHVPLGPLQKECFVLRVIQVQFVTSLILLNRQISLSENDLSFIVHLFALLTNERTDRRGKKADFCGALHVEH
jgi:hypothetical protein